MITALIFSAHIIFMLVIFVKKWQSDSLAAAFQNLIFIIIIFSVGWPLFTMLVKLFIPPEGLGINFDRDSIILLFLSAGEFFFYRFYYHELFVTEDGKEI